MQSTTSASSSLNCRFINPEGRLATELKNRLEHQGMVIDANAPENFIVWFNQSSITLEQVVQMIKENQENLSKILFISTPFNYESIQQIIPNIVGQGIDIRHIICRDEWGNDSRHAKNVPLDDLCNMLSQGKIPAATSAGYYPLNYPSTADALIRLWFDRGHRAKTVIIQGEMLPLSRIVQDAKTQNNQLVSVSWQGSEEYSLPTDAEIVTIPGGASLYSAYFQTCIPKREIPSYIPVVDKEPEKIIPAQDNPLPAVPHAPLPFQTVVVEDPLPQDIRPKQVISPPTSIPKKPHHFHIMPYLIGVFIVSVCLLAPYGIVGFHLWQGTRTNANTDSSIIHKRQSALNSAASLLSSISSITGEIPPFSWARNRLIPAINTTRAGLLQAEAQQQIAQAVKYTVTATGGNPYDSLQQARHVLDDLYLLQSTASQVNEEDKQWTMQTRKAIDIFPQLIPADKKITVAVLLQNNLELRPSGGFIGAVALLMFDHGKLLSYDTRDIYDLDSNLKGVVTPPQEIRTYLGESSWYFRDANWSPISAESLAMANWFLEKEWGSKADVVVAINLNSIKQILQATGSLTLPDGQIVSADNLLATAYNHQDVPSAKPDTKKQEFISLFIKPLLDLITTTSPTKTNAMINALGKSIEMGEMAIITGDQTTQAVLSDSGWTGTPIPVTCPIELREPCSQDTLLVSEANVGINKANYYISRTIDHQIALSADTATHTHKITFQNASPNDSWPAGSYKAYIRLLLPLGASQIQVNLDGRTLDTTDITVNNDKTTTRVGMFLEVKPQASATVTFSYQVPLLVAHQSYVFVLQKQAGMSSDPYTMRITSPAGQIVSRTGQLDRPLTFSVGE